MEDVPLTAGFRIGGKRATPVLLFRVAYGKLKTVGVTWTIGALASAGSDVEVNIVPDGCGPREYILPTGCGCSCGCCCGCSE